MHFDATGFLRVSGDARGLLPAVNDIFRNVRKGGGNVLVPAYSYSYASKQKYSIRDSACTLGAACDYLRAQNPDRRTADGNFSYLAFSDEIEERYFAPKDYATFGDDSLIERVFKQGGLLLSTGNRLHYSTEVHYFERQLKVPYRFDKVFSGTLVDLEGREHPQTITYYCRDLEFAQKQGLEVSFERLFDEMRAKNLVQVHEVDGDFQLEAVRMEDVYEIVRAKLRTEPHYLMKKSR